MKYISTYLGLYSRWTPMGWYPLGSLWQPLSPSHSQDVEKGSVFKSLLHSGQMWTRGDRELGRCFSGRQMPVTFYRKLALKSSRHSEIFTALCLHYFSLQRGTMSAATNVNQRR